MVHAWGPEKQKPPYRIEDFFRIVETPITEPKTIDTEESLLVNLWPFSKKNDESTDSHFELPPGVMLAPENPDHSEAPPSPEISTHMTIESLQSDMEAAAIQFETEANLQVGEPYTPEPVLELPEIQNQSAPIEAPYPNNHLLDLITPPATPDISWGTTQASQSPPMDILPQATEPISDLLEESFAMSEASDIAPFSDVTSFDEPFQIAFPEEAATTFDDIESVTTTASTGMEILSEPIEFMAPEPAHDSVLEMTEPVLNNVVPFPVRQTQPTESITEPLETTSLISDTTSFDSDFVFEFADTVESEEVTELGSAWETPSLHADFEVTAPDLSLDTALWEASTDIQDETYELTPPEETLITDSETLWSQNEISLFEEDAIHFDTSKLQPEDISLEPAVTPLEAYDSVLGLQQPDLIDETMLEPDTSWDLEESEASSSVKEWATYDMGHYDDPDDVVEPLVLDEEPVNPFSIIEEVLHEAIAAEESEAAESFTEESIIHQVAEPFTEPLQGEIIASDWKKPMVASKALNNFSQQVILEESHAIKRSIDELVNRYFAKES